MWEGEAPSQNITVVRAKEMEEEEPERSAAVMGFTR